LNQQVLAGAPAVLEAVGSGVASRCELRTGSFFDAVPAGGDVYTMKVTLAQLERDQPLN
jgi:hypothetical protein